MRAVVDTNILVSGLLRADNPPGRVLIDIGAGRLTPVVCTATLAEYRRVLPRKRLRIRSELVEELLNLIELTADWVAVPEYTGTPILPDASDWPFIGCAQVADCPVITGNARHFPDRLGIKVMSAREWLGTAAN